VSASVIGAISAENAEFRQGGRKGKCKRALNEHPKGSILGGGLVSKIQRNAAELIRNGVT
jgi:hypothetical protein